MADSDFDFPNSVVAADKSWFFKYNLSTKCQISECVGRGEPHAMKVRASKSKIKNTLIAFFDARNIIYKEFIPQNQTVSVEFYERVLIHLPA